MTLMSVFPTHVGMNRLTGATGAAITDVFPTHVGMNRVAAKVGELRKSYSPRTWG